MPPRICIVIINWNGQHDTIECLQSLQDDIYLNREIIVVDNGSKDDSVEVIRRQFPEVTVLETGENLGFTGGNNIGIRYALSLDFDFLFLLNNDTKVEIGALRTLVQAAQGAHQFGLFTPVIAYYDSPEEIWFGGSQIDLKQATAYHDNRNVPSPDQGLQEIPWASGCAMLIPTPVMRQLDGFDDRFFLNWEDVDLSLRVRALNLKIGLVPGAKILHKVGRSFAGGSSWARYYYVRNNLLFARIHAGRNYPRAARRILLSSLRHGLRTIKYKHAEARNPLLVTWHAWKDHSAGRYGRSASLWLLPRHVGKKMPNTLF